jgi:hypothetical protein
MRYLVLGLAALSMSAVAFAQVHVKGYTTKNGTYVAPHYRSSPNSTTLDNYSTKGNVNPYTGQPGTKNPYSNSTSSYGSYGRSNSNSSGLYRNPYSSSSGQSGNSSTTCYFPPC